MAATILKSILLSVLVSSFALADSVAPKILVNDLSLKGAGSTPANPSSGFYKLYPKSADGKIYILNSSGVESAVSGEPVIAAGTTSQYWRGDKSWQSFGSDVLATALAGLSTASSSTITSSDTVLSGLGKLQAQVTANTSSISGKEPTIAAGTTSQYWRGDKSWQTLDKTAAGLANVDNTSDATKNAASVTLTNKTISGSANTLSNIGYSSLSLTGSIVNADVSGSAAIAYSKLNLGLSIVNADVSASAAIALSKLAALNNSIVPVTNGSGILTSSAVTATQLGYLSTTTSDVQTQLNAKLTASSNLSDLTNASTARTNLGLGALATQSSPLAVGAGGTGQTTANTALNALLPAQGSNATKFLQTDGTNTSWASPSAASVATGGLVSSGFVQSSAFQTITATAVDDDTIPQSSEVTMVTALTITYTAASTSNKLHLTVVLNFQNDTSANVIIPAVFIDSGASAVAATRVLYTGASFVPHVVTLLFELTPSDTSSHVYKIGVGKIGGGLTINGVSGARKLGGVMYSSMKLEEIKG